MTREEIIGKVLDTVLWTRNASGDNKNILTNALVKALEKEPILDKIRAEIIENSIEDYKYHGCGTDELIIETSEVLNILDKYKGESE